MEEDFVDLDQRNSIPQDSEKESFPEPNSDNSEEEDDGSWIGLSIYKLKQRKC